MTCLFTSEATARRLATTDKSCWGLAVPGVLLPASGCGIIARMCIDKTALLFGPYRPPAVQVGDRVFCLLRGAEVVVYDWTLAPIPWPLCYLAGTRAFGKGFLSDEDMVRAVRNESSCAVQHWWGVSRKAVNNWRRALGVHRTEPEGSRRLIRQAALGGLNARRKHSPAAVRIWGPEEIELLGRLSDAEVARRTGRTLKAVTMMRRLRESPPNAE